MRRLILILAIAALSVTSCGGSDGDDEGGVAADRLSKAELIERGDQLCREFRPKRKRLQERFRRAADTEEEADLTREIADLADRNYEELRELTPPAGDARVIDRYLGAYRDNIGVLRRAADELDGNSLEAARLLLESSQEASAEIRGIAQGYGFQVCGRR